MDTPSLQSESKICISCNKEILPGEGHATHEGKHWHYGTCVKPITFKLQETRETSRPLSLGMGYGKAENPNEPPDTHLDLMVDIETLGTKPGCVVLSAAGVWFDRELAGTYVAFNDTYMIPDMLARGLVVEPKTAAWWFTQPGFFAMVDRMAVASSIEYSAEVINTTLGRAKRVWSCGPDFDPPILSHALGLDWPFWKNRDVRTMRDMLVNVEKAVASHDPLEDCERQIKEVRHAWIGSRLGTAGNST